MEQKFMIARMKTCLIQENGGQPTVIGSCEMLKDGFDDLIYAGIQKKVWEDTSPKEGKLIIIPYYD